MAKFYIDFQGYCEIEAENEQKAIKLFWKYLANNRPLPEALYVIEGVEEKKE